MSTTGSFHGPVSPALARLTETLRVRLLADVGDDRRVYTAGSTGTIIHVYKDGEAFEVEITNPIHGVLTVDAGALEPISP